MFFLGTTVNDGELTWREHLKRVAEQTGRPPEDLWEIPECPPEIYYLLDWFHELKTGPGNLTYLEIEAWATMTNRFPTPDEIAVLMQLDRELLLVLKN